MEEKEIIIQNNNIKSVIALSVFYTILASPFYFTVPNAFVIFLIGSTNLIGILVNIRSAKTVTVYNDHVEIKKAISKRIIKYKKREVFFSNTYNGMYSFSTTYGFTLKSRVNENGLGLFIVKNKNEELLLSDKIKEAGYRYKYTGW